MLAERQALRSWARYRLTRWLLASLRLDKSPAQRFIVDVVVSSSFLKRLRRKSPYASVKYGIYTQTTRRMVSWCVGFKR